MPHSSFTCHASVAPCLYIILCFPSAQAFGCKHKPLPWWSNLFLAWKCLFQAAPVYSIIVCTVMEVGNQPKDEVFQNTQPKLLLIYFFNFNFFFFGHTMQHVGSSSLIRYRTCTPTLEEWNLNHKESVMASQLLFYPILKVISLHAHTMLEYKMLTFKTSKKKFSNWGMKLSTY